jgi:hypothetical protein
MFRTDLTTSLAGNQSYTKWTVGYQDLGAAATTQTINLPWNAGAVNPQNFTIPRGGKLLGVMIKHTQAFAGPAISAMTVSVGIAGSVTLFTAAFDIFQAAADGTLSETALFKSGSIAPVPVTLTFTSTGANISVLTAGSVDVYLLTLNCTTPSA